MLRLLHRQRRLLQSRLRRKRLMQLKLHMDAHGGKRCFLHHAALHRRSPPPASATAVRCGRGSGWRCARPQHRRRVAEPRQRRVGVGEKIETPIPPIPRDAAETLAEAVSPTAT